MDKYANITAEYVRSILDYDPETGVFTWKHRDDVGKAWNTRYAGTIASSLEVRKRDGYKRIHISINKKFYRAHRLAYLIMTGEWPASTIDHKNGDASDNRWENIRLADFYQQNQNRLYSKISGLPKGVYTHKNGFRSRICIYGKIIHLGTFDCPAAASFAYQIAADIHFGEFARPL